MRTLDDVLLAADPRKAEVTVPPASASSLAAMFAALPVNTKQRHRRRAAIIGAALAGCLTIGGGVAYGLGGIHTGWFVPQGATENGRAGDEELNLSDPGIVAVVRAEEAKIQIPPGATWAGHLAQYPRPLKDGLPTAGTQQGIALQAQFWAACLWQKDWLHADTSRRAEDLAFMTEQFPGWDSSLRPVLAGLHGGDDTPLRQWLKANGPC